LRRDDDLSPAESAFLDEHLSTCATCRERAEAYEWVGAAVRSLPQEKPPASFRAAVFAQIAALANKDANTRSAKRGATATIAALSRADTLPEIPTLAPQTFAARQGRVGATPGGPIVRLPLSTSSALDHRRITLGRTVRMVAGLAAVFLVALMLAQFMRGVYSFGEIASNLFGGIHSQTSPDVQKYLPDGRYDLVTAALASTGWLVYSAVDSSGEAMLFGENRQAQQSSPLLARPAHTEITLYTLTTHWIIWSVGRAADSLLAQSPAQDTPWALYITLLPLGANLAHLSDGARAGLTHTLIASDSSRATLDGVWADDTMALVAVEQANGESVLERMTLTNSTITHAQVVYRANKGHRVMEPSADGGVIYWADVWADSGHTLHSAVWRQGADGQARPAFADDDNAFYPVATHGVLLWVSAQAPVAASPAMFAAASSADAPLFDTLSAFDPTATASVSTSPLVTLTGIAQAERLSTHQQWIVAQGVTAHSLQAAGDDALWRSDGQAHTYDLRSHAPCQVESQIDTAPITGLTSSSLTWAESDTGPIYVYNLPAAA